MNKKTILSVIAVSVLALSGCGKQTVEKTDSYELPDGLKDCHVFSMQEEGKMGTITVVRCPNSSTTTTRSGKGGYVANVTEEDAHNQIPNDVTEVPERNKFAKQKFEPEAKSEIVIDGRIYKKISR